MRVTFTHKPALKRVQQKVFILTPIIIIILALLVIFAREIAGFAILVLVVASYIISRKDWQFLNWGVEYFEIDGDSTRFKSFKINSKEQKVDVDSVLFKKIDQSEIMFKSRGKRYMMRKSELTSGIWPELLSELKNIESTS